MTKANSLDNAQSQFNTFVQTDQRANAIQFLVRR